MIMKRLPHLGGAAMELKHVGQNLAHGLVDFRSAQRPYFAAEPLP
jgi:hypothetical protein